MQSCGVRRPSVCLSVWLQTFCANRFFYQTNGWIATKLAHQGPQTGLHLGVLKVKVEVKGHVIRTLMWFHENRFFSQANGCILTKLSLSLTSPTICPFGFLPHSNPKWLSVCAVSSAIAHMVKQFVKLFSIQYGLTFSLCYMRSLYEAPLHSPSSISIRQLDLMSKSWNELFRHWRSSITAAPRWRYAKIQLCALTNKHFTAR